MRVENVGVGEGVVSVLLSRSEVGVGVGVGVGSSVGLTVGVGLRVGVGFKVGVGLRVGVGLPGLLVTEGLAEGAIVTVATGMVVG